MKQISRNAMKKNIICTPRECESLIDVIIRLLTGRRRNKSLLDWMKDNAFY